MNCPGFAGHWAQVTPAGHSAPHFPVARPFNCVKKADIQPIGGAKNAQLPCNMMFTQLVICHFPISLSDSVTLCPKSCPNLDWEWRTNVRVSHYG
jgi:hypothetical protein